VGRRLAHRVGLPFVDGDEAIEDSARMTVSEIFAQLGEAEFRAGEARVMRRLLEGPAIVLATGGGAILRPGNRDLLRRHGRPVAWLAASAAVLRGRIAADPSSATRRPALGGRDPLADVEPALAEREPFYRECADVVVDVADETPAQIADRLVRWLGQRSTDLTGEQAGPASA
jgi:shikimate kinase